MSRNWRTRSPARVVDDIVALRDRYGLEGIWFKDSIFNLNRMWTEEFCRLLRERQVGIQWQALTRVDLVKEDELRMMRDAGLTQLDLGIESGSARTLRRLNKGIDVAQIREKVALAKRYVNVFGFFMIGIPGEEIEDVEQTFALARELDLDRWSWSIYSPLPGSSLFDDLVREGRVSPRVAHGQVHFTEAYEGVSAIPPAKLKELYQEINEYFCARTAGRRPATAG
jgi:anaerobic magnesium-protoporphyrin IX monomethyl ester cyclase